MSAQIFTTRGRRRLLDVIKDGGGAFYLELFRLLQAPANANLVTGSIVDAAFSGYVSNFTSDIAIFWDVARIEGTSAVLEGAEVVFQHDGGPIAETVRGCYIVEAGLGRELEVISFEVFDAPQQMAGANDVMRITPRLMLNICE